MGGKRNDDGTRTLEAFAWSGLIYGLIPFLIQGRFVRPILSGSLELEPDFANAGCLELPR